MDILFSGHRGEADIEGPYRYRLVREWAPMLPSCAFVMLNPSTADATQDDATIRRCIAFATTWGFGRLDVVNLYAFRATDPRALLTIADPIGPRNDHALRAAVDASGMVVAAWGAGARPARAATVAAFLAERTPLHVLGLTKGGHPRHPLYVAKVTRPQRWQPGATRALGVA